MRDFIVQLLGEYKPPTTVPSGKSDGLYSLDFTWIVGAAAFLICLLGAISLIRILLKGIL